MNMYTNIHYIGAQIRHTDIASCMKKHNISHLIFKDICNLDKEFLFYKFKFKNYFPITKSALQHELILLCNINLTFP